MNTERSKYTKVLGLMKNRQDNFYKITFLTSKQLKFFMVFDQNAEKPESKFFFNQIEGTKLIQKLSRKVRVDLFKLLAMADLGRSQCCVPPLPAILWGMCLLWVRV
jgi:hypothetical protein